MPRKSWWARLPFGVRMVAGASALLVLIGGGTAGIAALTEEEHRVVNAVDQASSAGAAAMPEVPEAMVPRPPTADAGLGTEPQTDAAATDSRTSDEADRTATRGPRRTAADADPAPAEAAGGLDAKTPALASAVITTRTITEKRAIPFRTRLVRDPQMPRGSKRVQSPGAPGEEVLRYVVTYTDGQPTDRRLIDSTVTREPQHRVVAFGTRRGKGDGHGCRERPCFSGGRSAACPAGEDAAQESDAVQLGGSITVLDEDLYLLEPADLDGLELDPAMIC